MLDPHLAMVLDPSVVRVIGAERAGPPLISSQPRSGSGSGGSGGDQDGSDTGSALGERRWLLRRWVQVGDTLQGEPETLPGCSLVVVEVVGNAGKKCYKRLVITGFRTAANAGLSGYNFHDVYQ